MLCKNCYGVMMKHVLSFDDGKAYEFYRCPKCHAQSKQVPYNYSDYNMPIKAKQNNKRSKKRSG